MNRVGLLVSVALIHLSLPAAATTVPVTDFFCPQSYTQLAISPEGDLIAAVGRSDGYYEVIIVEPTKDKNTIVFKLEETSKSALRYITWIDANSLVVRYIDLRGQAHFLVIDFFEKNGKLALHSSDLKQSGVLVDPLPAEPDQVLLAVRAEPDRLLDVFKIDLRNLHPGFEFEDKLNGDVTFGLAYWTDHRHRLRLALSADSSELDADTELSLLYRDLNDNQWRPFYRFKEKSELFKPVGFIDDHTIAVITDINRDKAAVVSFSLRDEAFGDVLFASANHDVEGATLNASGQLKSVGIIVNGRPQQRFFSARVKSLQKKMARAFPGKQAFIYDTSTRGGKMLIATASAAHPGTFYYLDTKTLKAKILTDVHPQLHRYTLRPTKPIQVTTADGLVLDGLLTLPVKSKQPHPLVVFPHGGPIGVQEIEWFTPEFQFLADRGFAVLRINFRGSGGYGKEFVDKGVGQWGKGIEDDINAAVNQVLEKFPIDRTRMCMIGASYGGYSSLMSVIRMPDKYRCAISMFGVSDIELLFSQSYAMADETQREKWIEVYGDPNNPKNDPQQVSPFYLARLIEVPVMLITGWRDHIADPEQTHRLKVALDVLNKPNEYLLYTRAGHGHGAWDGDQHQWILIEQFLRRTMGLEYPRSDEEKRIRAEEFNQVGQAFIDGILVEQDNERALEYIKVAATYGIAQAQFALGESFDKGTGVEKDPEQAREWYLKAANAGDVQSQVRLGIACRDGELGFSADLDQAAKWFEKAANQGDSVGETLLRTVKPELYQSD